MILSFLSIKHTLEILFTCTHTRHRYSLLTRFNYLDLNIVLAMGIDGLSKVIAEKAIHGLKKQDIKSYFGRRIALDASCAIYQFLIALKGFSEGQGTELTNEAGEVTSHLVGLWSRTLRMVSEGIKPIYVFDGKPPDMKSHEISRRNKLAADAATGLQVATELKDDAMMERMSKRMVRVTREQNEECKKLLRLMGMPVVEAPEEAEAQCVELVRGGKAWAVGTEDMDALTFGATVMLRHLNYSQSGGIMEYHLEEVLRDLKLTREQFIDFCVLLGCDYTGKVAGIGSRASAGGNTSIWESGKAIGELRSGETSMDAGKL